MDETPAAPIHGEAESTVTWDNGSHAQSSVEHSPSIEPVVGLDGRDDRMHRILAAVAAFRDGDFSARLPLTWPGIEGRIAEAFNQTIAQEERIADEVTRLSITVGKEGRLKQRLSLPVAVGGWAEKTHSINTLIDDLVRPTTEVARTIGAVAKGDLSQ